MIIPLNRWKLQYLDNLCKSSPTDTCGTPSKRMIVLRSLSASVWAWFILKPAMQGGQGSLALIICHLVRFRSCTLLAAVCKRKRNHFNIHAAGETHLWSPWELHQQLPIWAGFAGDAHPKLSNGGELSQHDKRRLHLFDVSMAYHTPRASSHPHPHT